MEILDPAGQQSRSVFTKNATLQCGNAVLPGKWRKWEYMGGLFYFFPFVFFFNRDGGQGGFCKLSESSLKNESNTEAVIALHHVHGFHGILDLRRKKG